MLLLDLKDFKSINYITEEGKDEITQNTEEYPPLPGIILRKIIELEQARSRIFWRNVLD
jgi:hypothetical protein